MSFPYTVQTGAPPRIRCPRGLNPFQFQTEDLAGLRCEHSAETRADRPAYNSPEGAAGDRRPRPDRKRVWGRGIQDNGGTVSGTVEKCA